MARSDPLSKGASGGQVNGARGAGPDGARVPDGGKSQRPGVRLSSFDGAHAPQPEQDLRPSPARAEPEPGLTCGLAGPIMAAAMLSRAYVSDRYYGYYGDPDRGPGPEGAPS
jgi:hypothetical protein